ncbi:hypothetical protein C5E45_31055 [Nocardia nova]|uniref:SDR family oxidoreductase n=1 Tax=Nocardia nova TaxID=37330 RepID=A0A2S6AGR5_9NOCA|nr:SDR family NAD(P)-dependent oxidoreductase [Nocardia nova]PPJ21632.1 hypothetical protein C5E41_29395 [Nocardia nova]PPJ33962.1 hypothetical protein C5E45_31055 [Nocardia nova]
MITPRAPADATSISIGIKSLPVQAHYSAAKLAVDGLTKAAAIELGEYGIRVDSITCGVATPTVQDPNMVEVLRAHPNYGASMAACFPGFHSRARGHLRRGVYLASDLW